MKKNQTAKLLNILAENAGENIKIKSLLSQLTNDRHRGQEKNKKRKPNRRPHRRQDEFDNGQDPKHLLSELELLGMVKVNGARMQIKSDLSLRGRISMNPRGAGFVSVRGASADARDIFIPPRDVRDAFPGDEVIIAISDHRRERFEGKVLRVNNRGREEYRCKLLSRAKQGGIPGILLDTPGNIAACVPSNRIPADTISRLKQDKVVIVKLTGGKIYHMGALMQEVEYLRFEDDSDLDPDYARVLMKYNLDPVYPGHIPLPDEKEQPRPDNVRNWSSRKDLRNLDTITIDGADTKDFDDAISIEMVNKNIWRLYVHIADVSHYVRPGTPLDEEAYERATSVYLADRVVPMLPPALSENLCSLVAGKDRLAFTAEMDIYPRTGRVLESRFYKSIIRVDRRCTYDSVEEEIQADKKKIFKLKKSQIGKMWKLAQAMKATRIKDGRVDLNIPEPKIISDDDGKITAIKYKDRLRSTILIEEFMLTANIAVSEFIRKKDTPVLYRVHEKMDEEKLEALNEFFELYNIKMELKDTSHRSIQKALKAVASHPNRDKIERTFNIQLLRSFMQAKYTGNPIGHWGLGFKDYCHFTSPIRRYPDLVVHRVLERLIARKKPLYKMDQITEMGIHTSERERHAMDAERDMAKLKMIRYVMESGQTRFDGVLTGFRSDRVFLELVDIPVEGVVSYTHLTNDGELVLPNSFSVYVKRLSRPAFLGERWELELERADPEEMRLYFKPVWKKTRSPFQG